MALLTISGEPASRWEEVAHGAAQLLNFELVTETRLAQWITEEFGDAAIPDRAWKSALVSLVARMAAAHHLVVALPASESLFAPMPLVLRAGIVATEARRIGNLMIDHRLERPAARKLLLTLDLESKRKRRARFGRSGAVAQRFPLFAMRLRDTLDLVLLGVSEVQCHGQHPEPRPTAAVGSGSVVERLAHPLRQHDRRRRSSHEHRACHHRRSAQC
jgi:hypothetical protein